jgi:hypothetical protein
MPDESRLPPGATLRVTLLDHPSTPLRGPVRPAATGCGVCHRTWRQHRGSQWLVMSCGRCGIEFSDVCYFRRVTTKRERKAFWAEGGEHGYIFLCAGCRS